MTRDDDPKLTLDDNEWRQYKRATRALRYKRRTERTTEAEPLAWLRAVEWDDDGDLMLTESRNYRDMPLELVV